MVNCELASLGLSAEQRKKRRHSIGGSDANIIFGGDHEKIMALWREKRGEAEPVDLSCVLQVQLGCYTEAFNVAWFSMNTGKVVSGRGEERTIESGCGFPMTATLDGMIDGAVFEAKHVSAFSNMDECLEKYAPQLQHNMLVAGTHRAFLSVIFGNHKWDYVEVAADPIYQALLLDAEERFWRCVQTGDAPVAIDPPKARPSSFKEYDLSQSNAWSNWAAEYVANKLSADKFKNADKELRALIPDDASRAFGCGLEAKRDKRGAIRITLEKRK